MHIGWFVHNSTTTNMILSVPGFTTIDGFEITMSAPSATPSENGAMHVSTATTAGTTSFAHSILLDLNNGTPITRLSETYCAQHYDVDTSTNLTRRVVSGVLVGYGTDGSGNATIEIDYDRVTSAYKQYIKVWGS